jgi:flagellar biosynthesis protein FlhB
MADDEDADSKTEEASEKRINDALEKGNTPVSRDAVTAAGFLSLLLCMSFLIGSSGQRLFSALALMLENAGGIPLENGADAYRYLGYALRELGLFVGPMLLVFMAGGLAASFAQGAPAVVFDRIFPDLERISVFKGWKRIFGLAGLIELLKAVVKIAIVSSALAIAVNGDATLLRDAMRMDPAFLPDVASKIIIHLVSVVCIATALLAIADIAWTRTKWRRDLRMSRQELKEEHKEAEGDPLVKSRMRSLALARSRKRMMAAVPKATLIIANPTHYAIALRYVREEGGAPFVVAKGKDLLALKIREIGERHAIPVFEKKELVRAMYDLVEVDRMIPPEFFRPIAEIIHFLMSKPKAPQYR